MRKVVLFAIVGLLMSSCVRQTSALQPTAAEQELLGKISADHEVEILSLERRQSGDLLVVTRQGDTRVRYLLAPSPMDRSKLAIHLMEDVVPLPVSEDTTVGTGPDPRGIDLSRR
jgi:hypothetical protein